MRRGLWRALVLLSLVTIGAIGVIRSPTFQLFGEVFARGTPDKPLIALTFDDGPTRAATPDILDTLAAYDAVATFFVLGEALDQAPELGRSIVAAGHELGNHSYSHRRLILTRSSVVRHEIEATDAAIRAAGQTGPIQWRPPYGDSFVVLPWLLAQSGRTTVVWSTDGDGDPTVQSDPVRLADQVVSNARNGDIIVLHPMYRSGAGTRAALPAILAGLKARGFEFVKISELMALSRK